MPQKKILIISLSAGAGHVQAARALENTAQNFAQIQVKHIDLYNYITYQFKKATFSAYDLMVKRLPSLWGFLYEKTDSAKTIKRFNNLTKRLKQINALKFYKEIQNFDPDEIICTHFLATDLILNPPKKYKVDIPVSTVLTDYDLHNFWFHKGTKYYFVATDKMKWKIVKRKEQIPENVIVSGIPVDPKFYIPKDKLQLKQQYELQDLPTVLVLSGGQGMAKAEQIIEQLFSIDAKFNVVAIAGKNEKLKFDLDKLNPSQNVNLHTVGWTDAMSDYMKLSDLIVSKPGGLTTSESIVSGTPIIAIDPIPGQEEANTLYILENNLGRVAANYEDMLYYAEQYLNDKIKYQRKHYEKYAAEIILRTLI